MVQDDITTFLELKIKEKEGGGGGRSKTGRRGRGRRWRREIKNTSERDINK